MSQSTVSIVLSGRWAGRVSPDTAARIQQAARELGYRPNLAARSLRMERSGSVLLVVPALTNPFFGYLHEGAALAAASSNLRVVITPLGTEDRRPLPLPLQALDGLLVFGLDDPRLTELWGDVPRVGVDCDPRSYRDTVNTDIAAGTRSAFRHLYELGHREIGYLHVETRGAWTLTTRLRSLRAQVQRYPGTQLRVVPTTFDLGQTRQAASKLLSSQARPTALICEDDNVAVAAYGAAKAHGLTVPGDLSIVGYNDLPIAAALTPGLTTVRIPAADLGTAAMNALLARLEGGDPDLTRVRTDLVVRDSTGPVPAHVPG